MQATFRSLVSELGLHPIWHQKDGRIAGTCSSPFTPCTCSAPASRPLASPSAAESIRNRLRSWLRITITICRTAGSTIANR